MEILVGFIGLLIIVFIITSIVGIKPSERGVKERLSEYVGIVGPGISFIMPFIESVKKVDMRERVINTQSQEMITRDNVVVTVDAVIFTQVFDAAKAVYEVQDPFYAISNLSITTLRSIIGTMSLDEVLSERAHINTKVQTELTQETAKWGIQINKIEISRLDPPRDIQEAMSRQMKAEREKRARILEAEGMKQSQILEAEGQKQKQILGAEGQKESQILEAEGQSQAIERLAAAKAKALELESLAAIAYFKDNAVQKEQLKVIENALKGNSKFVIDTDILSGLTGFLNGFKK